MIKNRVEVLRQQQNKKFSDIARVIYIKQRKRLNGLNPKSAQQWRKF